MKVAVGSDHRGFALKQGILKLLRELGHECQDMGCPDSTSVDYPDIARKVARGVSGGSYGQGILICSTGLGMCIAANKIKGIRATLCTNVLMAQRAREHNDANVLCLGADFTDKDLAREIVTTYVTTSFEGGRHCRRLEKIEELERQPELGSP